MKKITRYLWKGIIVAGVLSVVDRIWKPKPQTPLPRGGASVMPQTQVPKPVLMTRREQNGDYTVYWEKIYFPTAPDLATSHAEINGTPVPDTDIHEDTNGTHMFLVIPHANRTEKLLVKVRVKAGNQYSDFSKIAVPKLQVQTAGSPSEWSRRDKVLVTSVVCLIAALIAVVLVAYNMNKANEMRQIELVRQQASDKLAEEIRRDRDAREKDNRDRDIREKMEREKADQERKDWEAKLLNRFNPGNAHHDDPGTRPATNPVAAAAPATRPEEPEIVTLTPQPWSDGKIHIRVKMGTWQDFIVFGDHVEYVPIPEDPAVTIKGANNKTLTQFDFRQEFLDRVGAGPLEVRSSDGAMVKVGSLVPVQDSRLYGKLYMSVERPDGKQRSWGTHVVYFTFPSEPGKQPSPPPQDVTPAPPASQPVATQPATTMSPASAPVVPPPVVQVPVPTQPQTDSTSQPVQPQLNRPVVIRSIEPGGVERYRLKGVLSQPANPERK